MDIKNKVVNLAGRIRYGIIVEWYNFWYLALRKKTQIVPHIASIDETIETIQTLKASISRFGDGEMRLIDGHGIGFQTYNSELSKRLLEILHSNEDKHLVCLADTFSDLYKYNRKARRFWRTYFYMHGNLWDKHLDPNKTYYNAFVTRLYMDYASKEKCKEWFANIKKIWNDRDIIFIEGEKSRLGVGNDLFDNAKTIKRILCPATNSYDKYELILSRASQEDKTTLFLIALGPTATVLAYDLYKRGYQAIDAGHMDVEYEWWKMGAKRKIKLARKYVNEAAGGNQVEECAGDEYEKQIIHRIV